MKLEQELQYLGQDYTVIASENEYIIHPAALGFVSLDAGAILTPFSCTYVVSDYKLYLKNMYIGHSNHDRLIEEHSFEESHEYNEKLVLYTGSLIIADGFIKEYIQGDVIPIFSYKTVIELVFNNGNLITTVDQSKAMLRIRKNLELGLRRLDKKRDYNCISRFIKSNLIGDYNPFPSTKKKLRYLEYMKKTYDTFF